MMKKPCCYDGDEPYIFVSYSRADKSLIYPIIDRMNADGCRVWYDNGMLKKNAREETADSRMESCGIFIAMLSENYLRSDSCKNEMNLARDKGCKMHLVYLTPCTMPAGMQMRYNRLQAFSWHTYEKKSDFFRALYLTEGMDAVRGEPAAEQNSADRWAESRAEAKFRKREIYGIRRYFPPGFRRGKPLNMVIAVLGYAFIAMCAVFASDLIFVQLGTLLTGLVMVAVANNYLDVQRLWTFSFIPNPHLRGIVRSVITVLAEIVILSAAALIFWSGDI